MCLWCLCTGLVGVGDKKSALVGREFDDVGHVANVAGETVAEEAAAVEQSAVVVCCMAGETVAVVWCTVGETVAEEAAAVEQSAVVVCCIAGETVAVVWCTDWIVDDQ